MILSYIMGILGNRPEGSGGTLAITRRHPILNRTVRATMAKPGWGNMLKTWTWSGLEPFWYY